MGCAHPPLCFSGKSCRLRCQWLVFEVMALAALQSGRFPLLGPWLQFIPSHHRELPSPLSWLGFWIKLPGCDKAPSQWLLVGMRGSFSFWCPRGGPFSKLWKHTHMETEGAGTSLPFPVVREKTSCLSSELSTSNLSASYVLTYEKKYCFQTNVFTLSRPSCSVSLLCLIPIIHSQWFKMHRPHSV